MKNEALEELIKKWEKRIENNRCDIMDLDDNHNSIAWKMLTTQNNTLRNCIRDLKKCAGQPVVDTEANEVLPGVSGLLPANNTTKIIKKQYEFDGLIDLVECCKIGPITDENYCPNCGKKILRQ